MSSLGSSKNGKRTALLHLYYNLLKTLPYLIIIFSLNAVFHFPVMDRAVTGVEIPLFHTCINILGAAIWLPLSNVIVKLAELTIPYSEKEKQEKEDVLPMLDPRLLANPAVAQGQVMSALQKIAETVSEGYNLSIRHEIPEEERKEELEILCARIARYVKQMQKYLLEISSKIKGGTENEALQRVQNMCEAFKKLGEILSTSIAFKEKMIAEGRHFSEEAIHDMLIMEESAQEIIDTTVAHLNTGNENLADTITITREMLSILLSMINNRHIRRVHSGVCDEALSTPFIDICYTFERVVDACDTIAHNFSGKKREESPKTREQLVESVKKLYQDKFLALKDDE